MFQKKSIVSVVCVALLAPGLALGQSSAVAMDPIALIKDEGMNRSQVMPTIRYLSDVIGPRLTNSPNQRRANRWTKEQLEKWGMKNAIIDPWGEFGRGWEIIRFNAAFSTPDQSMPFRAYPKGWSPGTNGAITSDVVYVDAADEAGLEAYKGKLKGAIVFTAPERDIKPGFEPTATRRSSESLTELEAAKPAVPAAPAAPAQADLDAAKFADRRNRFYYEEGAGVLIDSGFGVDAGTIRVMGASPPPLPAGAAPIRGRRAAAKNGSATIPQLVAEVEQYNRILRLVKQGVPVKMTVDLDVKFHDDDLQGYNTIAEIPGTDLSDEVVMIGAHLDSWHAGTGATDNGTGVTVVMEAMRILAASGLKPRRTIRVGLWTGEEQGLLGSRGYVAKNLATVGDGSDAALFGSFSGKPTAINKKPAHDKFAAYYNLDNGTGQIRGIYLQGNEALRPLFKEWFGPYKDWGASTVTINNTGGTDHLAFDAVGLPGFQFIQDQIEYFPRTWHTTQDVADRVIEEDLKRSSVIMAAFAYNSAMTDEKLERKTPAARTALAAFIPQFDFQNEIDEARFRKLGYGFSICGHDISHDEIPGGFPALLAVSQELRGYGG